MSCCEPGSARTQSSCLSALAVSPAARRHPTVFAVPDARESRLSRSLLFIVGLLVFVGCEVEPSNGPSIPFEAEGSGAAGTPSANLTPVDSQDPQDAVAEIEAVTGKIRRDSSGAIIDVDFRGLTIDDSQLASLVRFPRLRAVRLGGTAVTDEGMKTIGQIASLEDLDLRDCAISDDGLAHLVSLGRLKALRLSGKSGVCSVSDDGMVHVAKLGNLKLLAVDFLWISEDGIKSIVGLKNLEELYMAETTIGNEAVLLFAQFPKLTKLRIARNQIDASGVADLAKLQHLQELDLSECAQLLDDATGPLAELKKLKKLNLWRLNISDAGIQPLKGLTALESLNLDNTRLSDEGMAYLSGLTNLTFLHLGSTQITDAGLNSLAGLSKLEDLRVTRTAVTKDGVAALSKMLPNAKIQLEYIEGQ